LQLLEIDQGNTRKLIAFVAY